MSLRNYINILKDRQRESDELTYDDDLELSNEEIKERIADLREQAWLDSLEP
jgi:hypothetical protein